MNNKEVQQRLFFSEGGKRLDFSSFEWNEETNTFVTERDGLIIDFTGIDNCTFYVWHGCILKTGNNCIIKTGFGCQLKTGNNCRFETECSCTFETGINCVVTRRDTHEVIELKKGQKIRLNSCNIKGFIILDDQPTQN